jgi:hypothetical protein
VLLVSRFFAAFIFFWLSFRDVGVRLVWANQAKEVRDAAFLGVAY